MNLCVKCNIGSGFYPVNYKDKNLIYPKGFKECFNDKTKLINFFFNKEKEQYEPCFETCNTCNYGGNEEVNNCTSCDIDSIFRPEINLTTNCVKKCDKYPYIVLDEGNLECLIFNKFEIISIQMNPVINSKNEKFPIYYINKGIKNLTIKVAFNQNIRKRIELLNGNFEINRENNNSIIIKIEDINEKRIFNFRDNIDDSYHFGFEIDVVSSFDLLVVILIGVIVILSIILIIISICFCKKQKQSNDFKKNSFLQINNNNN